MLVTAAQQTESFGERLRRLRCERGLSQRELAGAGVGASYISRLEAGLRTPSVGVIRVLARRLAVTPEYLEDGREITGVAELELRLSEVELRLRLGEQSVNLRNDLRVLLREAEAAGEQEFALRAGIALGMAAFAAGEQEQTIFYLAPALAAPATNPRTHAGAYATLAKAYRFLGRAQDAVALLEGALDEVDEDDASARIRFGTYLSYALTDLGEVARAREVLLELVSTVSEGDPHSRVRLHWSLARVAHAEQNPRLALLEIRRAILLLDETENTLELARAHLFAAEVHLWEGDTAEAAAQLRFAGRLRQLSSDERDLGALVGGEALVAARSGDYERARVLAREALERLADAPAEQGVALFALALAETPRDPAVGADAFAGAVEALTASGMFREARFVLNEWVSRLREAGSDPGLVERAERTAQHMS